MSRTIPNEVTDGEPTDLERAIILSNEIGEGLEVCRAVLDDIADDLATDESVETEAEA